MLQIVTLANNMAKTKRIPINITDEQLAKVKLLMLQESRSRAYIVTKIFEDGLKLADKK